MKRKKTILQILICISVVALSISFPAIRGNIYEVAYADFVEEVQQKALSANIKIVQVQYEKGYNSSSMSVSAGASGVIIRREGNKYYALTAKHVIDEQETVDKTEIVVLGVNDLDYRDTLKNGGAFTGIADYYLKFPSVTVEYKKSEYDLALVSFVSDEEYAVLPLAEEAPQYGDKVAAISNPYRERNQVTAGKMGRQKQWNYADGEEKIQYTIVKHTAFISEGSSGSGLLNEDMEVVGINLGGNENIFRQFVSGMAMPTKEIRKFLDEWESAV